MLHNYNSIIQLFSSSLSIMPQHLYLSTIRTCLLMMSPSYQTFWKFWKECLVAGLCSMHILIILLFQNKLIQFSFLLSGFYELYNISVAYSVLSPVWHSTYLNFFPIQMQYVTSAAQVICFVLTVSAHDLALSVMIDHIPQIHQIFVY